PLVCVFVSRGFHLCSSVFFSRTSPPTRSTLFPYTTLFRSRLGDRRLHPRRRRRGADGGPGHGDLPARHGAARDRPLDPRDDRQRDRKSTRLNSSHVSISYADFCVKKKSDSTPGQERQEAAH